MYLFHNDGINNPVKVMYMPWPVVCCSSRNGNTNKRTIEICARTTESVLVLFLFPKLGVNVTETVVFLSYKAALLREAASVLTIVKEYKTPWKQPMFY